MVDSSANPSEVLHGGISNRLNREDYPSRAGAYGPSTRQGFGKGFTPNEWQRAHEDSGSKADDGRGWREMTNAATGLANPPPMQFRSAEPFTSVVRLDPRRGQDRVE